MVFAYTYTIHTSGQQIFGFQYHIYNIFKMHFNGAIRAIYRIAQFKNTFINQKCVLHFKPDL